MLGDKRATVNVAIVDRGARLSTQDRKKLERAGFIVVTKSDNRQIELVTVYKEAY